LLAASAPAAQKSHSRHLHSLQWSFARSSLQKDAQDSNLESPVSAELHGLRHDGGSYPAAHVQLPSALHSPLPEHVRSDVHRDPRVVVAAAVAVVAAAVAVVAAEGDVETDPGDDFSCRSCWKPLPPRDVGAAASLAPALTVGVPDGAVAAAQKSHA